MVKSPTSMYKKFKRMIQPRLNLLKKSYSQDLKDLKNSKGKTKKKADNWNLSIPEINKKLDLNCIKKVHHMNGSLQFII